MSEFASIPEHTKDNYRERVAAGEKWLAIHEQAIKDEAHDIAAWAAHEAELVQEVVDKVVGRTPTPTDTTPTPDATPAETPPAETPAP